MTEQDKKPVATTPPASPKATGDQPAAAPAVAKAAPPAQAVQPATKSAAAKGKAPAARPPRVRKPTQVEQTVAKHRQVLAEELVKAQAISYDKPKVMQPPAAPKKAPKKAAKAAEKAAEKGALKAVAKAAGKPAEKPAEKPAKARKPRLVRDSYAMPEIEYAQIALLKKRLAALGREVKKSELLRGGIAALAAFNDDELKAVMGRIERIKTGRPAKK